VAQVHAVRALSVVVANSDPAVREEIDAMLGRRDGTAPDLPLSAPAAWALKELLHRDDEVRDSLTALHSGTRPLREWRMPLYRSHRTAAAAGIRAVLCLALASTFFVLAGWPAADVSLGVVGVLIALGATTPNPQGFTVVALVGAPIVAVLAGTLEFLILDGATEFPLLALALGPFVIGTAVAMTSPHPVVSSLGRFNLIFILVVLSPSNPQTYDPNAFLFSVLFLFTGAAVLLAGQLVFPAATGESRQGWLLASARRELDHVLSRRDRRWAPEEAMFRDAVRIRQFASATSAGPRQRDTLGEILSYFDQAASIRLSHTRLAVLAGGVASDVVAAAGTALVARDPHRIGDAVRALAVTASAQDAGTREASDALVVAGTVIDAAQRAVEPTAEPAP
jgi:hypothetical protein